jgi:hypothetical protein
MSDSLVIIFGHLKKSQLTRVFLLRQAWQPFDGLPQYTILNGGKELGRAKDLWALMTLEYIL